MKTKSMNTGATKSRRGPSCRAPILQVRIPAKAAPLLSACAGFAGMSEQEYAWRALSAALQCDADSIRSDARAALDELERGEP